MQPDLGVSMADLDAAADNLFAFPAQKPKAVPVEPPRIVDGLDADKYHADVNTVSVGGLGLIRKSPLHYWWEHRRLGREAGKPTDEMIFGSAVHALILEPEQFAARFVERPAHITVRRGKEWEAFAATLNGRQELKPERYADAVAIGAAVRDNPLASSLVGGEGHRESSVYWTDKATGVRCRCRPDFAPAASDKASAMVLVDLKCTQDASDSAIARTAINMAWPMRAAWYLDGWRAATGESREYVFLAWEAAAPFACAAYYVEPETIEMGRDQYRKLLRIYAECLAADKWPSYPQMVQPLLLPSWFKGGTI